MLGAHDRLARVAAGAARGLDLEVVAAPRLDADELPAAGDADALLGPLVGLHLRHAGLTLLLARLRRLASVQRLVLLRLLARLGGRLRLRRRASAPPRAWLRSGFGSAAGFGCGDGLRFGAGAALRLGRRLPPRASPWRPASASTARRCGCRCGCGLRRHRCVLRSRSPERRPGSSPSGRWPRSLCSWTLGLWTEASVMNIDLPSSTGVRSTVPWSLTASPNLASRVRPISGWVSSRPRKRTVTLIRSPSSRNSIARWTLVVEVARRRSSASGGPP